MLLHSVFLYIDNSGKIAVKYVYDAWGNHSVLNPDGTVNASATHIGNLNPFRYRGYYYDVETGLYYLQTRYYDPEVGRFITIDDLQYLDPETINGLNLYAYCGNNPVMAIDPEGTKKKWWQWLLAGLIVVATIAAVVAVTVFMAGIGTAVAGALGGGIGATIFGSAVGGAITGAITGIIMGAGFSIVSQGMSVGYENIDWRKVGIDTVIGLGTGIVSGAIFGAISGAIKVGQAAKAWHGGAKAMISHFKNHGVKMGFKTVVQYTNAAKDVIKNGTYVVAKNAYVTALSAGKYNFVGVAQGGIKITTFGIRTFTKVVAKLLGLII